ncbi:1,3-beta-galactosyl-N-acetylhexosamine phosphorylase [Sphaerochaeta sp. S2]|uniref:1,3-beta-galactosyl-N-acetylhexosamine phosphorylase n=1 Tax=Sphaerochaeta sp. S2 TaxID=2798868 RepID=UPI0018E9D23A|nr:1,3-beta-galactosyl-N-acetylhexosamine phosphorylase [Sphaerochaeta sp. S2]MBJ2354819.1 1,3-beta-galactosyl-N-acetylhexosamine phosphorylase [Sphaerochaeta sp. S2]
MKVAKKSRGSFTMPGEAGYEELSLTLAEKWGADVIRDCDGTKLSPRLLEAGMDVYSTICIIREHNEFASTNPQFQQQTFLESERVVSTSKTIEIPLLSRYFSGQFEVNEASLPYWQVLDRTTGDEIFASSWQYNATTKSVTIEGCIPFHQYSVNFLAFRIWEEINMYNHVTNNWKSEPLRQLDPRYPEVQNYLSSYLVRWCEEHPETDVVRFTSLFYNFVWIWGSDERNRNLFTDWASYDFTVSPLALDQFEAQYGYRLTGEDFINKGNRNPSHVTWNKRMMDYLWFTNAFVCSYAKELVDIVHSYGKKAYVFYDDSWVGMEPQSEAFQTIGFDGIIKCVFSGFEVRLCNAVPGSLTHELRLHPYLFPVGLGGAPTFKEGGNPALDAQKYWVNVRRAMLRAPIDRIGLGGYLHLTEGFPDFVETIADIADQFRTIKELHQAAKVYTASLKIGIITRWGKLRTWTCGGHYHEHPDLDLINILESLSGLPYTVEFLNFDEVARDPLDSFDVLLNAGFQNSSYSGGDAWQRDDVVTSLTQWVWKGGTFLGINAPSSLNNSFKMAHVLGVDYDDGRRLCHGQWEYERVDGSLPKISLRAKEGIYLVDGSTEVLHVEDALPVLTERKFGKGKGIYLSEYRYSPENTFAIRSILEQNLAAEPLYASDNPHVDCAYYPEAQVLLLANGSESEEDVRIMTEKGKLYEVLEGFSLKVLDLSAYL